MSLSYQKFYGADSCLILNRDSTSTAGVMKIGTSASRYALGTTADREGVRFNFSTAATSGTARGLDTRLTVSAGAGGEALRSYLTCSSNTPADTVNGAHISLDFGASAGNVTGLGTAARCTLMVPSRSLGGTVAAVQAELWADGTASTTANGSCIRAVIDGNATGKAALEDAAYLINIDTGTNATGNVVNGAGNEPTWTSATHKIRIIANGTVMYLVAVLA